MKKDIQYKSNNLGEMENYTHRHYHLWFMHLRIQYCFLWQTKLLSHRESIGRTNCNYIHLNIQDTSLHLKN